MTTTPPTHDDDDESRPRGGFFVRVLGGVFSFRVMLALVTSAAVTAAVAGPMAYKANQAHNASLADGAIRAGSGAGGAGTAPNSSSATGGSSPSDPSAATPGGGPPGSGDPAGSGSPGTVGLSQQGRSSTTAPAGTPANPGTPVTKPSAPTTSVPLPHSSDGLKVTLNTDRSESVNLQGSILYKKVIVYVDEGSQTLTQVRFWFDNLATQGDANAADASAPFLLGTPVFDTSTLDPGSHTLTAEITFGDGHIEMRSASFGVAAEPPT